ncbi:hypothetical protein DFH09DRAFT_1315972 [Mycena vulgaris]|nr:hypothetical protein DFH09DRAFT_1315972 [Mycena vulgaris]
MKFILSIALLAFAAITAAAPTTGCGDGRRDAENSLDVPSVDGKLHELCVFF